jgi:ABC-type multidrug transport system fused ATPase/permease subunit
MPDKGKIIIDNNEIKNYFRINNLTYVPQTTFLIDDTLKNNIILNRKYNLEKYMTALKYSGLLDYYSSLTNKDENLGENAAKISGGQMQRISIARAIYDSPKLIILDEPTSSIDKETTLEIYKNLKLLNKNTNCTIITVSHDDIPEDFASVNYYVNNGNIVKKK